MPTNPFFFGQPSCKQRIFVEGEEVEKVMYQGVQIYPLPDIEFKDRPKTLSRTVDDGGKKWFEFGFLSSEILAGNSAVGFVDEIGYAHQFIQYSVDLQHWSYGKFVPAPVPIVAQPDGTYYYWSRALNPVNAAVKTGAIVCASSSGNGDSRNNPFSSIIIAGEVQDLPNYPYTMPTDAAQLQTDLRAAGWDDAVVLATSDVDWSIAVPSVNYTSLTQYSRISWPSYTVPDPIFVGQNIVVSGRSFTGSFVDADGVPIHTKGFARLGIQPGPRFGFAAITYPTNPVFVEPPPVIIPPPGEGVPPPPTQTEAPPYLYPPGQSLAITGSHASGATLTRPTLTWDNPHESEMVVVGTWWLNGVETAEHGETFAADDGDLVQYIETATNAIGPSQSWSSSPVFAVSDSAAAYQAEMHTGLAGLISGKAGAADMTVFSAQNHTAGIYTRNAGLWAASLVSQLTGCASWKTKPIESYGGVMITPRHVLYCNHAHPHAEGTWIYPSPPCVVRFVKTDGSVVNAIQICQTDYNSSKPGYISPTSYTPNNLDLCVAVLDRDVTLDGIHVFPIPQQRSAEEWSAFNPTGAPKIAVSQGTGRSTTTVPPEPISDYPQYHRAMVYIRTIGGSLAADAPYDLLDYRVWDGDSGTPQFLLHRGALYLEGILVSTPWGRVPVALHVARINQMIAAADAGAVAMGRLAAPTGLTVEAVVLPVD